MKPLIISIPHSGEEVPPEADWLMNLPEEVLMCDVDRYVDRLYQPALESLAIPHVVSKWHRYSGDLNRLPEDVDESTVRGSPNPKGQFSRGFLWANTTTGIPLMKCPASVNTYHSLVKKYFEPFHEELKNKVSQLRSGTKEIYHIDAHSMPSKGTKEHRDPGQLRPDFVISDQNGKSCRPEFLELVVQAYSQEGFTTKVNWPYIGGRITELYGRPSQGHHTLQVEMNRGLYMNEETKKILPEKAALMENSLIRIVKAIVDGIQKF